MPRLLFLGLLLQTDARYGYFLVLRLALRLQITTACGGGESMAQATNLDELGRKWGSCTSASLLWASGFCWGLVVELYQEVVSLQGSPYTFLLTIPLVRFAI